MDGIVDAAALAELAPPTTDDAQDDVAPPLRGLLLLLPHPQWTPGVTFARGKYFLSSKFVIIPGNL